LQTTSAQPADTLKGRKGDRTLQVVFHVLTDGINRSAGASPCWLGDTTSKEALRLKHQRQVSIEQLVKSEDFQIHRLARVAVDQGADPMQHRLKRKTAESKVQHTILSQIEVDHEFPPRTEHH
jgi:hypothetical protein